MKCNSIILSVIMCLASFVCNAQTTAGEVQAFKIAVKIKDTLSLRQGQQDSLYTINLSLLAQSLAVWHQYEGNDTQIQTHLQAIENTRDSLYRPVLSQQQFLLYKGKKKYLISNN